MVAVVFVAITVINQQREQPTIADGIRNNERNGLEEAATTSEATATDEAENLPAEAVEGPIFQQEYKLNFEPVTDAVQPILMVKASSIAEGNRVRTIDIDGQTYWIYAKPDAVAIDSTERFIGLVVDSDLYELGTIGGDVYVKEVAIEKVALFGKDYMRLSGLCGANCVINRYVQVDGGVLVRNIYFNYPTQAADWNNDGINELIYSDSSMPVNSILVRFKGDQLEAVSLIDLLQAKGGVTYDSDSNTFNAYMPFNDTASEFVYEPGDKLIQNVK